IFARRHYQAPFGHTHGDNDRSAPPSARTRKANKREDEHHFFFPLALRLRESVSAVVPFSTAMPKSALLMVNELVKVAALQRDGEADYFGLSVGRQVFPRQCAPCLFLDLCGDEFGTGIPLDVKEVRRFEAAGRLLRAAPNGRDVAVKGEIYFCRI